MNELSTNNGQSLSQEVQSSQTTSAQTEKMSETDRLSLELAKSRRQTALAQAEKAIAVNEHAELQYRYLVLQLYMKYSLTAADAINENGEIVRGGAAAVDAQRAQ